MERTIDHSALEQYSNAFSEQVLNKAYAHQEKISGQAILSISPVKQVNFFIIKALFDQWQREIDSLKSPYFDYGDEEVQIALEEFMNVLSQHILVAESQLNPFAKAAVQDTLLLILSPATYYQQTLDRIDHQQLYLEDVKEWIKYVKIHRGPLEKLLDRIAATDGVGASKSEADQWLQEAARELTLEDPAEYLSLFSQVATVAEDDLVESTPSPSDSAVEASTSSSEEQEPLTDLSPEEESPGLKTLNDELSPSQRATLADIHRQQKIENIKTYIGVNQRFMFIRELFDNNTDEYNRALDELEQKNTYIEAFNHLRNEYAQPHRWKMDSEEVVEFLEIVAKRF